MSSQVASQVNIQRTLLDAQDTLELRSIISGLYYTQLIIHTFESYNTWNDDIHERHAYDMI